MPVGWGGYGAADPLYHEVPEAVRVRQKALPKRCPQVGQFESQVPSRWCTRRHLGRLLRPRLGRVPPPRECRRRHNGHFMHNLVTRVPKATKSLRGDDDALDRSSLSTKADSVHGSVRPDRRPARGAASPTRRRSSRRQAPRSSPRPASRGALAPAPVEQFAPAAEQGDPLPHRRRRHLPRPDRDRPPGRRRARRTTARMGGARRCMSAESIAKSLADPVDDPRRGSRSKRPRSRQARMTRSASGHHLTGRGQSRPRGWYITNGAG
jgi:hypothetical protein